QLGVRHRLPWHEGAVAPTHSRQVDVAVADPLLAVLGWLAVPCGEVAHVHRHHPGPGHGVQYRLHERATGRKRGHVRCVTDKNLARLRSHTNPSESTHIPDAGVPGTHLSMQLRLSG